MNAKVRKVETDADRILGARVEFDGKTIGRVRRNDTRRWTAYDPQGRRISTTNPTRADAVQDVVANHIW